MILVAGSTGLVGNEICQKLAANGEKVRGLVRTSSSQDTIRGLERSGVETVVGDLKDPDSLRDACQGVDAVVSTASSTLSRQAGDSIESVDRAGQLNLVNASRGCGVERFVFVSFRRSPAFSFPLADAKRDVEQAIQKMNFSIIQASWFMEVWLSAAFGFDYANATARIYGPGTSPASWVSYRDVAEMCCIALRHPAAERQTIEFGGPEAISPLDVVARFERLSGRRFKVEHIPEESLRTQFDKATDPMEKSIAALMLGYAHGDAIDMAPVVEEFNLRLTSLEEYARRVMGRAAKA